MEGVVLRARVSSDWEKGGWDWEGCEERWVGKAVVDEEGEEVWMWEGEEGEEERRERRLGSLDLEALISRSTLCVGGWLDGVIEVLS